KPSFKKCREYRGSCCSPKASQPISVVDSFNCDWWIRRSSDSPRIITASTSACVIGHDTQPVDCVCLGDWNLRRDFWTWLAGFQGLGRRPVAEMATRLVDHPIGNWLLNRIANSSRDYRISDGGNSASNRITSSRIANTILCGRPNSRRTDRRSLSDAAQSSLFLAQVPSRVSWLLAYLNSNVPLPTTCPLILMSTR